VAFPVVVEMAGHKSRLICLSVASAIGLLVDSPEVREDSPIYLSHISVLSNVVLKAAGHASPLLTPGQRIY
jgi:hypothetical protein